MSSSSRFTALRFMLWLAALVVSSCPADRTEAAEKQKPLWLVVGSEELTKPIQPLAERRRGEGFETLIAAGPVEKVLAASRRPAFLLLVGDEEPGMEARPWRVPSKQMDLYRWRRVQRKKFASDAAWGDLNGDLVPDVPVGRIPARTPKQVELVVAKILQYEKRQPTAADLRLLVWAGSPEYSPAIDAMASKLLLMMLRTNSPRWTAPWIISGDKNHCLSGWPPDQPAAFTRQIRRGSLMTVLMGHADTDRFLSMSHEGKRIWYTADAAEAALRAGPPTAPMVVFSCNSGNFAGEATCLTESFLFFPGGPVATVGATTESHPLTNYFSGVCLLQQLHGPNDRIGTVFLRAQRNALTARNFLIEPVLRDVEGKLEDEINVAKLRRDQALMYALLGDPATRLRLPRPLKASVRFDDGRWHWSAERPEGAERLQVGYRPAAWPEAIQKPNPGEEEKARAAFQAAASALAYEELPSPPPKGPWQDTVDRPGYLRLVATGGGKIHVAVLKLEEEKGLGARD